MSTYNLSDFMFESRNNEKCLNKAWSIILDIHKIAKEKNHTTLYVDMNKDRFFANHEKDILKYLIQLGFQLNIKKEQNMMYVDISWKKTESVEAYQFVNIKNFYLTYLQKQIYSTINPISYTEGLDNHYKFELSRSYYKYIKNDLLLFERYIREDTVKCLKEYINAGNVFIRIDEDEGCIAIYVDIFPYDKSVRMLTQELRHEESILDKIKRALSLKW